MRAHLKPTLTNWCQEKTPKQIARYCLIFIAAAILLALGITLATPEKAHAIPPLLIVGGVVLALSGGIALAGTGAMDGISTMLRDAINGLLDMMSTMISMITHGETLTSKFSELFEGLYPILYHVHHTAVIPIAQIVVMILFVFGLVKLFADAGQHETGIDIFRIVFLFMFFGIAYNIVNYSFEIMLSVYSLITSLANSVLGAGTEALGSTFHPVDSDVSNAGVLFMMLISTLLSWLVTVVVFLLSQVVIVVRSIKIYTYTCFAPLPLACVINETSRPIATGFLKRYIAVVGAGVIMAWLFIMFAAIAGATATTSVPPDSLENIMRWEIEIISSLVVLIAFGWCIFKSESWARDFVGC